MRNAYYFRKRCLSFLLLIILIAVPIFKTNGAANGPKNVLQVKKVSSVLLNNMEIENDRLYTNIVNGDDIYILILMMKIILSELGSIKQAKAFKKSLVTKIGYLFT